MKHLSTILCLALFATMPLQGMAQDNVSTQRKGVKIVPPKEVTEEVSEAEQPGLVAYQVLLAEIALRRGEIGLASELYKDLALQTRNVDALERATEISIFANNYDQALTVLNVWREVEPASKRAQQRLIQTLVLSTPLEELPPKLIKVLQAQPESLAENLLSLNTVFARVHDRTAVYRAFQKIGEHFSGIAEAHYAVALAANAAGASQHMETEIDRALELRPDWEVAAFVKAQYLARRSSQEAIDFMQDFLKINPEAREVELQLARLLISEQRYADSKAHFEQLLKIYPESPEVLYPAAILALQQENKPLAEEYLKRLVALDISDKNRAYYYLGQIAEDMRHNDQAIAYYGKITAGEHYLTAQIRRAKIWGESGKTEQANKILQETKAKTPEEKITLALAQATLLREAGQVQEAFDALNALLQENPDNPELLYDSALLAERLEKHEEMEKRLLRLIDLRPDNPLAYNALGYSLADRDIRLPEARAMIEKAHELVPDDSYILDSLGWVLFKQGENEKALPLLKRAYEVRADPEIAVHIGKVLQALGRHDEARKFMQEALYSAPTSESLLQALRKIEH